MLQSLTIVVKQINPNCKGRENINYTFGIFKEENSSDNLFVSYVESINEFEMIYKFITEKANDLFPEQILYVPNG